MDRVVRIRVPESFSRDRLAGEWRRAASQPNWIVRAAMMVLLLVVALPILLLVGLAAVVAIIVVGGLALIRAGAAKLRRLVRGDGRSNVRVIRRIDD
ncbi:MAG: hypothetical protein ACYSU7_04920 [Planctomycetota bacterium]|jgi:uncharacterized membrane protein HdeD (DUF308 family)